ncbi:MAG: 2OG-Fe dioxygenase family protein [Tatlockia sp.]|nr:2OG-Fe dioxygenase family protein [Tatlockia sp.]
MKRKECLSTNKQLATSQIDQTGFFYIPGSVFEALLEPEHWDDFTAHWDALNVDEYAIERGIKRKRSYVRLLYKGREKSLQPYQDHEFFQDKTINQTFGGMKRNFSQPDDSFITSQALYNILLFDFNCFPLSQEERNQDWFFGIHQISNYADNDSAGLVTPEGIHTDGHLFSAQHFIQSSNIARGGVSRIYDANQCLVKETSFNQRFDTILLHDQKMYHDVTPFYPDDKEIKAFRSMLLIDFDPVPTGGLNNE